MPKTRKPKPQPVKSISIRFPETCLKAINDAIASQKKTRPDGMNFQRFAVTAVVEAAEKINNPAA